MNLNGAINANGSGPAVTLTADSMTLSGSISATTTGAVTAIKNRNAGTTFGLGASGTGAIQIPSNPNINTPTLEIGRKVPASGNINISGLSSLGTISTLVLRTGGGVSVSSGEIPVPNLAIDAGNAVSVAVSSGTSNVAVQSENGGISLTKSSGNFNIYKYTAPSGAADDVTGLSCAAGQTISITAGGTVGQDAAAPVNAGATGVLSLNGTGTYTLANTANDAGYIRAGDGSTGPAQVNYTDSNGFTVGSGAQGIRTHNGEVTLTAGTSGSITLAEAIDAGSGVVSLSSGAGISQNTGKTITTAGGLKISGGGAVSLGEDNAVGLLAASLSGTGNVTFKTTQALSIGTAAGVSGLGASGRAVSLVSTGGGITRSAGNITLGSLTGSAAGAVDLTGTGNTIPFIAGFTVNAGSGDAFFKLATSGGLTVNGAIISTAGTGGSQDTDITLSAADAVTLEAGLSADTALSNSGIISVTTTGSISQTAGTVSGAGVTLSAGSSITQAAGSIKAGADVSLTATSTFIQTAGDITAGAGVTLSAGTGITQAAGNIEAGDTVSLSASGSIETAGTITANTTAGIAVSLSAGTSITQTGGSISAGTGAGIAVSLSAGTGISQTAGTITAAELDAQAVSGISLPSNNEATRVHLTNTGTTGNIAYTSNIAFTVDAHNAAVAGTIDLTNIAGGLTVGTAGIESNNGHITFYVDAAMISESATAFINAGNAKVAVRNMTGGKTFRLGGTTPPRDIEIDSAVLGLIQAAGILEIGRGGSDTIKAGNIYVDSVPSISGCDTLVLRTGADISTGIGSLGLDIENLAVQAGGDVDIPLHSNTLQVAVDTSAATTGGDITITGGGGFEIADLSAKAGGIAGLEGLTCPSGRNITLSAEGGVTQESGTSIKASVLNLLSTAGTGTFTLTNAGNDITFLRAGGPSTGPAQVNYSDSNGFAVGSGGQGIRTGGITALSTGAGYITQTQPIITGDLILSGTTSGITLDNTSNQVNRLEVETTGGPVSFYNSTFLTLTRLQTPTGANAVSTGGENLSLRGTGITLDSGKTINTGAGTIALDGGGGAVNLLNGTTTTTNSSTTAMQVINASGVSLGTVSVTGRLVLGTNTEKITGAVTQGAGTVKVSAGSLSGYAGPVTLDNTANTIPLIAGFTVSAVSGDAFFKLATSGGLTVNGDISTASTAGSQDTDITLSAVGTVTLGAGLSADTASSNSGDISVTTTGSISQSTGTAITGDTVNLTATNSSISTAGNITGNTVNLTATGTSTTSYIRQTAGTITAAELNARAAKGVGLPYSGISANAAVIVHLYNGPGGGNITYANSTAFTVDALNETPSGTIEITGTGTNSGDTMDFGDLGSLSYGTSYSGTGLKSNDGNITVSGDYMNLTAMGINAGTAKVTIRNQDEGKTFTLGGSSDSVPSNIFVSDVVLNLITANLLEIGRTNPGNASGKITVQDVANIGCETLILRTGADITTPSASGQLPVKNLAVEAGSDVELTLTNDNKNIAVNATISTLSPYTGGSVYLTSTSTDPLSFTIATIEGVIGLTCKAGGEIVLEAVGAVTQEAAAPVVAGVAGKLVLLGTASYDLDNSTANNTGTLAANLTGSGASLLYTDTNGFTVDTVSYTPPSASAATVTGVATTNGAQVLTARTGTLTVNQAVSTGGGTVGLIAASGSLAVNAGVRSSGGTITLSQSGTGSVTVNADGSGPDGFIDSTSAGAGGNVTITANGAVNFTAAGGTPYVDSSASTTGNGGTVSISSNGAVGLGAAAYIKSSSAAGTGGDVGISGVGISLAAGAGGAASIVSTGTVKGGDVTLDGKTSAVTLSASGANAASIKSSSAGTGGTVIIKSTSTSGVVTLGAGAFVNSSSASSGDGGPVTISSTYRAVTLGEGASVNSSASSGAGGGVSITGGGAVTLGAAAYINSSSSGGTGTGGGVGISGVGISLDAGAGGAASIVSTGTVKGGAVTLNGNTGAVTLSASGVNAASINSSSSSGAGGDVIITAAGTVNFNASGGTAASIDSSAPGNGGAVSISSINGAVGLGAGRFVNSSSTSSGNGGAVTVTAGGTVTLGAVAGVSINSSATSGTGGSVGISGTGISLNADSTGAASIVSTGTGQGGAVTLNGKTGVVALNAYGTNAASINSSGGTGGAVNLTGTAGSGTITLAGGVSIRSGTGAGGNVALWLPLTLSAPASPPSPSPAVSIDTGPGAGDISFSDTVNGNIDLDLTAGTGTITFAGAVGGSTGANAVGDGAGPAITAGADAVSFASTVNTQSGLDITATNTATGISFAGNVTIGPGASAADVTTLKGNVTLGGSGQLTVSAGRDITFGDSVNKLTSLTNSHTDPVIIQTTANDGNIIFNGDITGNQNLIIQAMPNTGTMSAGKVTLNGDVTVGSTPKLPWPKAAFKVDASELIMASGADIITTGHANGNVYLRVDGLFLVKLANDLNLGTWPDGGDARVTSRDPTQPIEYGSTQRYDDSSTALEPVAFFGSDWRNVQAGTYTVGDPLHTANIYVTGVPGSGLPIALTIENGTGGIIRFEDDYTSNNMPLRLITPERLEFEHLDFGSGSKQDLGTSPYSIAATPLVVDLGTAGFAVDSPILLKGDDPDNPTTLEIKAQGIAVSPFYTPDAGIVLDKGIEGELAGNNRLILDAGFAGTAGNIGSAGDHRGDIIISGTSSSSLGTSALPLGDLIINNANDVSLKIPVHTAPNSAALTAGKVDITHSGILTVSGDIGSAGGFFEKAGTGYEAAAQVNVVPLDAPGGNPVDNAAITITGKSISFGEEISSAGTKRSLVLELDTASAPGDITIEKPVSISGYFHGSRINPANTGRAVLGRSSSPGNITTAGSDIRFAVPLVLNNHTELRTTGADLNPSPFPGFGTGPGNIFLNGAADGAGSYGLTLTAGVNSQRTFTLESGEVKVNQLTVQGLTVNRGIIDAGDSALAGPGDPADNTLADSAFAPGIYSVRFVNDYTGASPGDPNSGVLKGRNPNTYILFGGDLSAGYSLPAPGTGWLVFQDTSDQVFENNTNTREIPHVLINHGNNGTGVLLKNSSVLQRDGELVIRRGFLDLTGNNWHMAGSSGSSAVPGFHGVGGRLTLGYMNPSNGGAKLFMNRLPSLNGGGFRTESGFTMNALGVNEITSVKSVDINSGTTGISTFGHVAFVMNLLIPEAFNSPILAIRGLSLGGGELTPQSDLSILEDVVIRNNGILNGTGRKFTVGRNWNQNFPGAQFVHRNSVVVFTGQNALTRDPGNNQVPPYITISGNTTWWDFICEKPNLTLRFSTSTGASTSYHYVENLFRIWAGSEGDRITLSRNAWPWELPWPDPPTGPWPAPAPYNSSNPVNELERTKFWDLLVANGAKLEMQYVDIYYNYSRTTIPIPINVQAAPFLRHFCFNWMIRISLMYSFTEDADGNGRIDRIRVQSSVPIQNSREAFLNLKVTVEGYEVDTSRGINGYARAGDSASQRDSFYIYLKEKDYEDGDSLLKLRIENNTLMAEQGTYLLTPMVGPDGYMTTTDTVPPRISYSLMLPEKNELFIQLSEPMVNPNGGDLEFVIPGNPVKSSRELRTKDWYPIEFLLSLTNSYKVEDLASGNTRFTLNAHDRAARAADLFNPQDPSDYVSPKYPVDWSYGSYATVRGSGTAADPFRDDQNRPIRTGSAYAMVPPNWLPPESPSDRTYYHRLTDVLISLPPEKASDTRYFLWPLWAKDNATTVVGNGQMWGVPYADFGVIWDFSGAETLQDRDIVLQAKLNDRLAPANYTAELYYASRVPDVFLARTEHGPLGLWLPPFTQSNYVNIVPRPYTAAFPAIKTDVVPGILNYGLSKEVYSNLGQVEFFFQLQGGRIPLYVARLDIPRGGDIPTDWYRRIKPFSFRIHDITLQRSGVTILNNVIDPNKGEKTYVDYKLNRNGRVTIQVFTLDGTMVQVLQRGSQGAGEYRVSWDGKNRGGRAVARGLYFIRVVGPEIDEIRKVMVVK
jgi:hypothetical protein